MIMLLTVKGTRLWKKNNYVIKLSFIGIANFLFLVLFNNEIRWVFVHQQKFSFQKAYFYC